MVSSLIYTSGKRVMLTGNPALIVAFGATVLAGAIAFDLYKNGLPKHFMAETPMTDEPGLVEVTTEHQEAGSLPPTRLS